MSQEQPKEIQPKFNFNLSQIFENVMRTFSGRKRKSSDEELYVSPERQTYGDMRALAVQLNKPIRLTIGEDIVWFDKFGTRLEDDFNISRFETLFKDGQIPSYADKSADRVLEGYVLDLSGLFPGQSIDINGRFFSLEEIKKLQSLKG